MDILVISPTPTHPATAGNRARILSLLLQLKSFGHTIHFCYVGREGNDPESLEEMRRTWDRFSFIPYDRSREKPSLAGGIYGIDDWIAPNLRGFLEYLKSVETPDVVIVEYVFLSEALTYFPDSVRVIDTHDVFADRHLKLQALGLPRSFFYTTRDEERKGLQRAHLTLAIQDREAQQLRRAGARMVLTCGYLPAHIAPPTEAPSTVSEHVVGYVGSVNPINVLALRQLLELIDLGRLAEAGFVFKVAGTICDALPAEVREAAEARGVTFVGPVEDPVAFLAGCTLVVNPHMGGTGLKIKTVDSLAAGPAVVGTLDAFEGIATPSPLQQLPDVAAVAAAVQSLCETPSALAELAEVSREVYQAYAATVEASLAPFRSSGALQARLGHAATLLIVTDIAFWRRKLGNQVRLATLIEAMPASISVTVFVLLTLTQQDRQEIDELGVSVEVISFAEYRAGFDQTVAQDVESRNVLTPYERKSFSRLFYYCLTQLLAVRRFDMLMVEYIRLTYLRAAPEAPAVSILDTHDIMCCRVENFAMFGKVHFIQLNAPDEFEILDKFNYVACIQPKELALVNGILPAKAIYLPHVVVPAPPTEPVEAPCIGFIGGDSPMNEDGIKWFLAQVWPLFAPTGAQLHIAGRVCTKLEGRPEAAQRGVRLLLEVDDIEGFYRSLAVAINPVFYGGGIKIKSIEAMAHSVPLVASPEAAFGIESAAGKAYLLGRSRRDFAAAVLKLLASPQLRVRMGEAGRAFVEQACAPRLVQKTFEQLVAVYGTPQ